MAITTEFSKSFIVYRQAPQWLSNQNNNQQQAGGEFRMPFTIYRENPEGGLGKTCNSASPLTPLSEECVCGPGTVLNCGGSNSNGKYCYADSTGKLGCHKTLNEGAQTLILNQFGDVQIWEGTTRKTAQDDFDSDNSGILVSPGKNYIIYVTKPVDASQGATWGIKGITDEVFEYSDGDLDGDWMTISADGKRYKAEFTAPTEKGVYKITVDIIGVGEKTENIFVNDATTGVSPNGICGPATSGSNQGKTGICLNGCSDINKDITPFISDNTRKCQGDKPCCVS